GTFEENSNKRRKGWGPTYPSSPEPMAIKLGRDIVLIPDAKVLPPPVRDVKVTGANGWLQLAFPQVREPRRSLVGYRVGYRRHGERKWRYVVSKAVQYSSERPFVRPRHPCRAFRADRTFCVLLTDHVRLAHALDARLYHLTTFRIVPEEEEEVISPETFRTSFNLTSCDWAVEGACPAIGVDEGLTTGAPPPASRRARAVSRTPPPLHATVPYPLKRKGPPRPDQQMQERFKKYRREKNLWIHFLSLSLALALFGGPLLHMAAKWQTSELRGTSEKQIKQHRMRYGGKLARSFWSKMKNNVEKQEIESKPIVSVEEYRSSRKQESLWNGKSVVYFHGMA
ncbi:Protein of unknown function, partial [Gryllus bimaculatus]